MTDMNLKSYAYLGDAVWELWVREHTILQTENSKELHQITTDKVKMSFQTTLLHDMEEDLTEEEQDLARRGRNLSIPVGRKSDQAEYRQATAFEVLIGWWHRNNKERLEYFLGKIERKYF